MKENYYSNAQDYDCTNCLYYKGKHHGRIHCSAGFCPFMSGLVKQVRRMRRYYGSQNK